MLVEEKRDKIKFGFHNLDSMTKFPITKAFKITHILLEQNKSKICYMHTFMWNITF